MRTRLLLTWLSVLLFAITEAQNYDYPSPVTTSMGLSGATDTTTWSLFSNPSGLSFLDQPSIGVGYHNAFGISALSARSAFVAIPNKMFTPGFSYVQYGDDLYKIQTFSGTAARTISPNLRMGIRFDYLLRQIHGADNQTALTVDAGLSYSPSQKVRIALLAQNPARSVITDEYREQILPSSLAFGCTFRLSKVFYLTADLNHREDLSRQIYSFGMAFHLQKKACVQGVLSAKPVRLALGSTLQWKGVEINFSANYHDLLGLSSTAGIAYMFDLRKGGDH